MPPFLVQCPECKIRLMSPRAKTCMGCRPQSRRTGTTAHDARLAKARKAGLTGRDLVLALMDEATWENQVVEWARQGGWCGVHLQQSHLVGGGRGNGGKAALRGVHVKRWHDHDDSFGLPDWRFWRAPDGYVAEVIEVELKIWGEELRPDQERVIAALVAAGQRVYLWQPLDEVQVRTVLLKPQLSPFMLEPQSQASRGVAALVRDKQREILERRLRGEPPLVQVEPPWP